jgi:hypothetical protein
MGLATDLGAVPAVFDVSGPVPTTALREWVRRQSRAIPDDLVALWELIGGGDIFETEEIFAPVTDPDHEIDKANRHFKQSGLPAEYLVFHAGLYLTAIDSHGRIVQLDPDMLEPTGLFASIDDWYNDLRGEYGPKYGLPE